MKSFYLIILFIVLYKNPAFSQQQSDVFFRNNYQVLSDLTVQSFEKYFLDFFTVGGDSIYLTQFDVENEQSDFLFNLFKSKFPMYKIVKFTAGNISKYEFVFKKINFSIKYSSASKGYFTNKSVKRAAEINYFADVRMKDSTIKQIFVSDQAVDTIRYDDIVNAETGNEKFLVAEKPEITFVEKFLVPAILTAISAAAIIMFFFIRSN